MSTPILIAPVTQITGDDTPALQAVLDADVWRKHLLAEQEVWLASLGATSILMRTL
jgi:hypothetical protein